MEDLVTRLRGAASLAVLLDYDGTLVPFAPTPDAAAPDEELIGLLAGVAGRPGTKVGIVSGRDRDSLGRWLGDLPVELTAEHGFWRKRGRAAEWEPTLPVREEDVARVRSALEETSAPLGGRIEVKRVGAAWHYRGLDVPEASVAALVATLERAVEPLAFAVLRGSCVVEVRPRGIDKGAAVRRASEEHRGAMLVAVGDDRTDEDMFRALPEGGIGIHVGGGETLASERLADHVEVRRLLASLVSS